MSPNDSRSPYTPLRRSSGNRCHSAATRPLRASAAARLRGVRRSALRRTLSSWFASSSTVAPLTKTRRVVGASGTRSRAARESRPRIRSEPLIGRHVRLVDRSRPYAVDELADRPEAHGVLTEARQDSLDVGHEGSRRADHEDTAALETPAVGVQEVGGSVQRDDGLAGARTTADDGDAAGRCPDRLVLLGLDGGDDVAHRVPTGPRQRRHQRAFTHHRQVLGRTLGAEQVVLDADDLGALVAQDATPDDAEAVGRGRAVERLGRRGPPVDHERLVLGVADADPADVQALQVGRGSCRRLLVAAVGVEPAEHQALVLGVQLGDPPGRREHQDVTLVQAGLLLVADTADILRLSALMTLDRDPGRRSGAASTRVVDPVDVLLLELQFSPLDRLGIG